MLRESLSRQYLARFTPSQWEAMEKFVREYDEKDIASLLRKAVSKFLKNENNAAKEVLPVSAPVITSASCGAFDEAILDTETAFVVSPDIAKELDFHEGDVFIRARGDSMAAMGITDGSLVTIEILPAGRNPRANEVALVQIEREGGEYESTLKRWTMKSGVPVLLDGEGNEKKIPDDTVKITPIGVARSFIARI